MMKLLVVVVLTLCVLGALASDDSDLRMLKRLLDAFAKKEAEKEENVELTIHKKDLDELQGAVHNLDVMLKRIEGKDLGTRAISQAGWDGNNFKVSLQKTYQCSKQNAVASTCNTFEVEFTYNDGTPGPPAIEDQDQDGKISWTTGNSKSATFPGVPNDPSIGFKVKVSGGGMGAKTVCCNDDDCCGSASGNSALPGNCCFYKTTDYTGIKLW